MEKYLIVLDLDETLLNSKKLISPYTKSILKRCKEEGCKIVVNTARSYKRAIDYSIEIKADFICTFNGNYVCDSDNNVIYNNPIAIEKSKDIINILSRYNSRIISEGLYTSFCTDMVDIDFVDSIFAPIDLIKNLESYKILVKCTPNEYSLMRNVVDELNLSITFSREKETVRIMNKWTDKWNGINRLKNYLQDDYKVIAFGDDSTDLLTLKNADIGVRMKDSVTEVIENIDFSTDSNNDDGVAKFLCNFFNFEGRPIKYQNIKVLDCTLRDGGHLNKSLFGYDTIKKIIYNLVEAKIDIVEMGFLQGKDYNKDIAIYPNVSQAEDVIKGIDCKETIISLLTQVDKFDVDDLEECSGKVKLIRVSFHNNYIDKGMNFCKKVKEKGYLCSINPINFSHYNNQEIVELVTKVNKVNPDIFSIVDTFGTLLNNDFKNKLNLINHLLNKKIQIGIHLHDNLGLAFSSVQTLVETNSYYGEIIVDSSVMGMGRAPGNLKTELLLYYINKKIGNNKYDLSYIYELIETVIKRFREKFNWESKFAYSITALEQTHRTYAECLQNRNIKLQEIEEIIQLIPDENRGKFNETVIDQIQRKRRGD
ncbi:MAG: HAD hydrolase family protein [Clostridia bacterium]|nr:HAD hydrolase family protein [Clostridia bacterium]